MGPLVLILISFLLTVEATPTVTIEDYFGNVYWPADSPKEVTCRASNVEGSGKFVWKLGERVLENKNEPTDDFDEITETLEFKPQIVDDDRDLSCSFIDDKQVESKADVLRIRVVFSDIKDTTDVSQLKVGERGELVAEFEAFPEPQPNKIFWIVGTERIPIAGKGGNGRFQSSSLSNPTGIKYSVTLTITEVLKEDGNEKVQLEIETGQPMNLVKKTMEVRFAVNDLEPVKEDENEEAEGSPKSDSPMTSKLSTGVIVIIILVILVILISIGYCAYKKYGRTTKPEEPQKPSYAPVATGEPAKNPV